MKRIVKWVALTVVVLAACGFVAFLYLVPPLMSTDPQVFIDGEAAMAPPVDGIADPAVRALAERGRYVLLTTECTGCHVTPSPQGHQPDMYLAGGRRFTTNTHGVVVSRNLTPDKETGLGDWTVDQFIATMKTGRHQGKGRPLLPPMPWPVVGSLNDEDIRSLFAYLQSLPPASNRVPQPIDPPESR
jgi:cytochrome c553